MRDNIVWRFGSWVPDVSFPSGWLMVGAQLVEVLQRSSAEFRRVRSIVVTDPSSDWREWGGKTDQELRKMYLKYDVNEDEEIVLPFEAFGLDGRLVEPVSTIRMDMMEMASPEYWLITAPNKLEQIRLDDEGNLNGVRGVVFGEGVHRIPWLYANDVCVEDWVRDALAERDKPGLIGFEPIPVFD